MVFLLRGFAILQLCVFLATLQLGVVFPAWFSILTLLQLCVVSETYGFFARVVFWRGYFAIFSALRVSAQNVALRGFRNCSMRL